jgi:PAS domain S-box-containing protein
MHPPDRKKAGVLNDALDVGLIVLANDERILDWNAWLAQASGIAKAKAIGATLSDLLPQLSSPRFHGAVRQALDHGASSVLSHSLHPNLFPLRTMTGRALIHDVAIKAIGEHPQRRCIVQIFDVTRAAEREAVLRERHDARYAAVVDNAPDAILTIDDRALIQFANPAVLREFGYEPRELMGQPAAMLFHTGREVDRVWSAIGAGAPGQHSIAVVGKRKNGSLTHLEVTASTWTSRSRTFATIILRDVNERHAAEAALRKLNETLEERVAIAIKQRKVLADIVEDTDALIQVVDADLRLLAINRAGANEFKRLFGEAPRGGASVIAFLRAHGGDADGMEELWRRALDGERFTVTRRVSDETRGERHYELKFNALRDAAGATAGAYLFVYDVTERITRQEQLDRTEEALRQSQKMEAIGQLTGGIAHDFNNLLAGIIGAMELLRRRISAGRYEDTQRFMDAAVASANRAAALTHRLLAFARRQPLDPRPLEPNQLVRSMEDLLRRSMGEQVQLDVDLAPEVWLVNTDANQLENAILNLAINARDAMPDGGRLTISTQNATVDAPIQEAGGALHTGDYMVLCVADTGTGMSAELIAKVFDPFFTTKPIGQGTGLGLSMVYGFAQQSGGYARIESEEGAGTSVKLYLPRYRGALEQQVELGRGKTLAAGEGETVLLVEDDSAVRLLIGEVLRDLGYRCVEAIDAHAALPMITSNARIDLLITDVGLPRMNGRQLAEIARRHRPELRILFVTGYAEHATGVERFLEPGMELVTKPFTLDALALKIRDMISVR